MITHPFLVGPSAVTVALSEEQVVLCLEVLDGVCGAPTETSGRGRDAVTTARGSRRADAESDFGPLTELVRRHGQRFPADA